MNQTMERQIRRTNRQIKRLYIAAADKAIRDAKSTLERLAMWQPDPRLGRMTPEQERRARAQNFERVNRETNLLGNMVREMAIAGTGATGLIDNSNTTIYQHQYGSTARNIGKQAGMSIGGAAALSQDQAKRQLKNEQRSRAQARSRKRLAGLNGETRGRANKKVRASILSGLENGESISNLANRVKSAFLGGNNALSAFDAKRIARTEAVRVLNQASSRAAEMLEKKFGIMTDKKWLSGHDEAVRAAHLAMDGVTVGRTEVFKTKLGDLLYPGDPNGEPANVINCRCTHIYIVRL